MRAFSALTIFTVLSVSLFTLAAPVDLIALITGDTSVAGKRQVDVHAAVEAFVDRRGEGGSLSKRQVGAHAVVEAFVDRGEDAILPKRQVDIDAAFVEGDILSKRQVDAHAAVEAFVDRGEGDILSKRQVDIDADVEAFVDRRGE